VKNTLILANLFILFAIAITIGIYNSQEKTNKADKKINNKEKILFKLQQDAPYIGKIEVLNGCGIDGAASIVADYLRNKKFDVKFIGNAPTATYEKTLIVSRKKDTNIARQVAQAFGTESFIIMRNGNEMYDVTVIVGKDYKELLH
jgi:hypothetical protein